MSVCVYAFPFRVYPGYKSKIVDYFFFFKICQLKYFRLISYSFFFVQPKVFPKPQSNVPNYHKLPDVFTTSLTNRNKTNQTRVSPRAVCILPEWTWCVRVCIPLSLSANYLLTTTVLLQKWVGGGGGGGVRGKALWPSIRVFAPAQGPNVSFKQDKRGAGFLLKSDSDILRMWQDRLERNVQRDRQRDRKKMTERCGCLVTHSCSSGLCEKLVFCRWQCRNTHWAWFCGFLLWAPLLKQLWRFWRRAKCRKLASHK